MTTEKNSAQIYDPTKLPEEIRRYIDFVVKQTVDSAISTTNTKLEQLAANSKEGKELADKAMIKIQAMKDHPYDEIFGKLLSEDELGKVVEKATWKYVRNTVDRLSSTAGHTIDDFKKSADEELERTARSYLEQGFLGEFLTKVGLNYKTVVRTMLVAASLAIVASGFSLWSLYNLKKSEVGQLEVQIENCNYKINTLDSTLRQYRDAFGTPEELKKTLEQYAVKDKEPKPVN
jgi:hypothetical protein